MATTAKATIELRSTFSAGEKIPRRFSGEGENYSPPLRWSGVPENARELVLLVHDPDAPQGDFVHWVLYNIPPNVNALPEHVATVEQPPEVNGAVQGTNDMDGLGYTGPLPPRGHGLHHYHFQVFALDKELNLPPGLTRDEVLQKTRGHVIASGELVGVFERS